MASQNQSEEPEIEEGVSSAEDSGSSDEDPCEDQNSCLDQEGTEQTDTDEDCFEEPREERVNINGIVNMKWCCLTGN